MRRHNLLLLNLLVSCNLDIFLYFPSCYLIRGVRACSYCSEVKKYIED